jgi:hypothetical protein
MGYFRPRFFLGFRRIRSRISEGRKLCNALMAYVLFLHVSRLGGWNGARSGLRIERDNIECIFAVNPVNIEITIESKNRPETFKLCERHERSIGAVHRRVLVLFHQFPHSLPFIGAGRMDPDHVLFNERPEGFLSLPLSKLSQKIQRLGDTGPGGEKRAGKRLEGGFTPSVIALPLVEKGNHRAGVDEGHGSFNPCFSSLAITPLPNASRSLVGRSNGSRLSNTPRRSSTGS